MVKTSTVTDNKPGKIIQDDWTQKFCGEVQNLEQDKRLSSYKFFASKLGIDKSALSHILGGRRNYPAKYRLLAETVLAKVNGGDELFLLESAITENVTFAELLRANEKLSTEIAFLKSKLVDKELIISAQMMLIDVLRNSIQKL